MTWPGSTHFDSRCLVRLHHTKKGRTPYEQGIYEGGIPKGPIRTYLTEPERGGGAFYQGVVWVRRTHRYGAAVEVKDPAFYSDPTTRLYLASELSS